VAAKPSPKENDEYEVRVRCNVAMGWTRWPAGGNPVGPMPAFTTREEEIEWISERLMGHEAAPGSEVRAYREDRVPARGV
jgi:hypothetical protein